MDIRRKEEGSPSNSEKGGRETPPQAVGILSPELTYLWRYPFPWTTR
jgi:hypothetical protein